MTDPRPVPLLVEHLFRTCCSRMVAGLTRVFGTGSIQLAEEVVQEAMVRALQRWPFDGVPETPELWLAQVAKNLAIDRVRRSAMAARKEQELQHWAEVAGQARADRPPPDEIADDTLRMIFTCCHPALPFEGRVALTLKTLCGFGVPEIARAFLQREPTVAQRLVRAKERLRLEAVEFAVPQGADLERRLDDVLAVIYLLFNEGYSATTGDVPVRGEMVQEALRLGRLVARTAELQRPKVHALLSLMLLQASRLPARATGTGELLTLAAQDRGRWDRGLIGEGMVQFAACIGGDELTAYHVEAAIASCHAMATSYADTDWPAILGHYDVLLRLQPSPVVRLNRAVALAKAQGPAVGLADLAALADARELRNYALLPATQGTLLWALGQNAEGAERLSAAAAMPCSEPEKELFLRRAEHCARGEPVEGW